VSAAAARPAEARCERCSRPVERAATGRPRRYCSQACAAAAARERRRKARPDDLGLRLDARRPAAELEITGWRPRTCDFAGCRRRPRRALAWSESAGTVAPVAYCLAHARLVRIAVGGPLLIDRPVESVPWEPEEGQG
jgi:hypothetical protein